MKTIFEALTVLLKHGNAVDMPQEYLHQICTIMYEAGAEASKKADDAYLAKSNPEINDYSEYAANLLASVIVIKFSLELNTNEDDEVKLERYKKISSITAMPLSTEPKLRAVYKKEWNSYLSKYVYNLDQSKTIAAIAIIAKNVNEQFGDETLANIIEKLEKKAEAKKKAEKKKAEEAKKARIKAYWEAHKEEKDKLESEKKQLSEKVKSLGAQIVDLSTQIGAIQAEKPSRFPSDIEADKIRDQISKLNTRKSKLGLFAGKEKKQIAEEIAALEGRLPALRAKAEEEKKALAEEVNKKVSPLKQQKDKLEKEKATASKRISAIETELTKDPE